MNYKLKVGGTNEINTKPTLRDINIAIDSLNIDNADPFIVLESSEPINGTKYVQVLRYKDYDNMKTYYRCEMQIGDRNSFKQYKYITDNKAEIKKFFEDYFLYGKSPDINTWLDITVEILEHKNVHDVFYLYDLAKNYHRKKKKIYNCYDLSHGDNIATATAYQSVAEAIILFEDIMRSNGNYGEIYFTEDKIRFFIDIVVPDNWKETIKEVYRVKALLRKDKISIACYDQGNNFIPSSISPLQRLERLLSCFILIFTEKLLSAETFLYTVMDYFFMPDFEKFENVYTDFLFQPKYNSYYVTYESDENYNLGGFTPLPKLYETIINNIQNRNK